MQGKEMKIAFGMIVFNGDYVLKQTLEQIYPFASQILIAEGPVPFWQERGFSGSMDYTNKILYDFPDPDGKIRVTHGRNNGGWFGKDDQCNGYMKFLKDDTDYLWQIDSDEVYKKEDIEKVISFLEDKKPDSVGVRPYSFFGGFDNYVGGYELATDNFLRIFKVHPGSRWATHRPPTMVHKPEFRQFPNVHVTSDELWERLGVAMYHYSYVFPSQVQSKMEYYESKVAINKIIPNYFTKVWLRWVLTDLVMAKKQEHAGGHRLVESLYCGVHEFKPEFRGDAYTMKFAGEHPEAIRRDMKELQERIENEIKPFI
jgi:hypothetical protein